MVERSQDWMDEAVGDLEHARNDREHGFYNWACFSSQQSAEKAVEAVFQKMGADYVALERGQCSLVKP